MFEHSSNTWKKWNNLITWVPLLALWKKVKLITGTMNIQNYGAWQYMQQRLGPVNTQKQITWKILKMWTWDSQYMKWESIGNDRWKRKLLKWTEGKETNRLGYILDGITYWEYNRRGNKRKEQSKGRITGLGPITRQKTKMEWTEMVIFLNSCLKINKKQPNSCLFYTYCKKLNCYAIFVTGGL